MKFLSMLPMLLVAGISFGAVSSQTDWSGGSGVPGPVTDWGDCYNTGTDLSFEEEVLSLVTTFAECPLEHSICDSIWGPCSVSACDVDGDGDTDVLGAASYSSDVFWWENTQGSGTSWTEHTVDAEFGRAHSVFACDVDGDGDNDILGAAQNDDDITWWENTDGSGSSWIEHTVDGAYDGAVSVYASDMDGDSDTDILGAAYYANAITWWENTDGSGSSWIKHTVDGNYTGAGSVYAHDVDGDGDNDVLGAAYNANAITWWENTDGSGSSWIEHTVDGDFNGAWSVYPSDVDGDGDCDLLGAAVNDDDITWWENTDGSGGSWIEHTVCGDFDGAISVCVLDADCDGDVDVLGAAYYANAIALWENTDGSGTSWAEHPVCEEYTGAMSVYASDVDGDGDSDVLGAAELLCRTNWWDMICFEESGMLESSVLEAGTVEEWELFYSNRTVPEETSIGFQFRSSNDYTSMGAWSDTLYSAGVNLSGILADSTNYFQYRVILQTADPSVSPVLQDVSVSYTICVSIEDQSSGASGWNLAPLSNPCSGGGSVLVSLPLAAQVNLVVHDLSGRVVSESSRELEAGTHSVLFSGMPEGVYFCTMSSGEFTATERLTVLE